MDEVLTTAVMIEGFFDCSCVWAFLGFEHLRRKAPELGVAVRWRPVVAEDLFATVNPAAHREPPSAKVAYHARDQREWADFLGLTLAAAAPTGFDVRGCMLACVAAGRWGRQEAFISAAFEGLWTEAKDLGDAAVLEALWARAGLPGEVLRPSLSWPDVAQELQRNTRELMERGGFGVPTFFVADDMFFGNDSIPLVERAVRARLKAIGA